MVQKLNEQFGNAVDSVRELQRAVESSYHQFNRDTKGYSDCCKLEDTLWEVNAHFGAKVKRKPSLSVPIRYYISYTNLQPVPSRYYHHISYTNV